MSRKQTELSLGNMCDQVLAGKETKVEDASRRVWIQNFGLISASAAVAWACGSSSDNKAVAASATLTRDELIADANAYNAALALEHEAIAIYSAAAGLGDAIWSAGVSALAPSLLAVATEFLGHHTAHRNAIIGKINAIKPSTGVSAVEAIGGSTYTDHYPGIAGLNGASGLLTVLQVAAEREMNAANAYHGILLSFNDRTSIQFMGGTSADEAAHYGVLNAAAFAFAFLSSQSSTAAITAANMVSGAYPPFVYSRAGLRS
ncbi:MAG: hypothetical protein EOP07_21495 [Proteobacteria bacterium]|nr:MAG: hypothetical protein EOP07_21495 [Pseudomonadota bacterium]